MRVFFVCCCLVLLFLTALVRGVDYNFEALGAISDNDAMDVQLANGALLNLSLGALKPGDTFLVPNKTFHLVGGIMVDSWTNVTFILDGTLFFSDDRDTWPVNSNGDVEECMAFGYLENVVFTSTGKGTLNGNGKKWWGAIDFLKYQEDRPRLFHVHQSKNMIFEHILLKGLKSADHFPSSLSPVSQYIIFFFICMMHFLVLNLLDSPYWSFYAENCDGLIVRYSDVDVRWDNADRHTLLDLQVNSRPLHMTIVFRHFLALCS